MLQNYRCKDIKPMDHLIHIFISLLSKPVPYSSYAVEGKKNVFVDIDDSLLIVKCLPFNST